MEHTLGNLRITPVLTETEKDKALLTRQEFICEFENIEPMVIKVNVYSNEAKPENLIGETRIEAGSVTGGDNLEKWFELHKDSKLAGKIMIRFRFEETTEEDYSPQLYERARARASEGANKKRNSEEIFYKITVDENDSKPELSLID